MNREEIVDRIAHTLRSVLGHDQFPMHDDLTAGQVEGWDSLTHMMIITGIEKEFGVKFKLKEINKLKNLGSLIELVGNKLRGSA